MRLLCQQIAVRANDEDQEVGKFWQARFRAVRLLDEQALLACCAYVDLNPIRAAMAETLEASDHTSIQRRIQAQQASESKPAASKRANVLPVQSPCETQKPDTNKSRNPQPVALPASPDGFLSPLTLEERTGELGAVPSQGGLRCSDKGFLPLSQGDYLALLNWTARQSVPGKRGATPKSLRPIFERLSLDPKIWCSLVGSFGRLFYNVAGLPPTIEATASRVTQKRYYVPSGASNLFEEVTEHVSA